MKSLFFKASPLIQFSRGMLLTREICANMSARADVEKKCVSSFWRKNTPEERAKMQNERRKRKRKARSLKKEEERNKIVLALEDERARTAAKNERLLFLARKYYTKWQILHRLERVRNFLNLFRGLIHDFILVRGSLIEPDNHAQNIKTRWKVYK